jgi:hypothetical protein
MHKKKARSRDRAFCFEQTAQDTLPELAQIKGTALIVDVLTPVQRSLSQPSNETFGRQAVLGSLLCAE